MDAEARTFRSSRTVGFWLAVVMTVLQGVNAVRTLANPAGFARYMGLPVEQSEALDWVQVYGLRAGFIAILTAILLARADFATLSWMALAALVMPLGDAWLAADAGAPMVIIARHLCVAVFLLVAWYFLSRAARSKAVQGSR